MMKQLLFRGMATALVTPMHPDGSVDLQTLARLTEWQIQSGAAALVPCGTTGEAATLTLQERTTVIRTVAGTASGRVPVIAGAGCNDTARALENCKSAAAAGADALLLVTPYYNKTTQAGLVAHFTAMAEAGGVKVLIPHHMDLAMSEDVYLPRIEEMERAVHARVPGCTVITPERLKWYHMGLSVWT